MSLATSVCLGRAGAQGCSEEQEHLRGGCGSREAGMQEREGESKDLYFWAVGQSSGTDCGSFTGCCGEQTSSGLGTAFPGSQPLEAALLQLLSFYSSG